MAQESRGAPRVNGLKISRTFDQGSEDLTAPDLQVSSRYSALSAILGV